MLHLLRSVKRTNTDRPQKKTIEVNANPIKATGDHTRRGALLSLLRGGAGLAALSILPTPSHANAIPEDTPSIPEGYKAEPEVVAAAEKGGLVTEADDKATRDLIFLFHICNDGIRNCN